MRQTKRFLAFALALMMFMSNTVSASATSAGNGLLSGQNTGESTQNVVTVEPTLSEPSSAEPTSEPESSVPETSEVPSSEGASTEPTTIESTSVAETTTEEATTEEPTTEEATTEETSEELTAEVSKDETSEAHTEPQDGDIAYVSMDGDYYYFTSIGDAIAYADENGTEGEKYTVSQHVGEDTASTPTFTVSGNELMTEKVSITLQLSYDLSVTGTESTNTALSNVNVFNNNSVDKTRPTVKVASGTSLQILEGGWHNLNLKFEGDNGTLILGDEDKTYTSYPVPVNIDSTTVTGLKNLKVYAPTSWGYRYDYIEENPAVADAFDLNLSNLIVDIEENGSYSYGFNAGGSITTDIFTLDNGKMDITDLTVNESMTAKEGTQLFLYHDANITNLSTGNNVAEKKFELYCVTSYRDSMSADNVISSPSVHLRGILNTEDNMVMMQYNGIVTDNGYGGDANKPISPYVLNDIVVTVTPGEGKTVADFTNLTYYGLELANGVVAYLEPQETDIDGTYDLVLAQDYNEIRLLMFKGESEEPIAEKGFRTFADVKTYINNKNDGDMEYRILVNEAVSFAGDDLNYAGVTAKSVGLDMPNKLTATDNAVIAMDYIDGQQYENDAAIPGSYTDIDLKTKSGMSLDIVPRNGYANVEGIRILSNGSILNLGNAGSDNTVSGNSVSGNSVSGNTVSGNNIPSADSDLYFDASVNGKLALLNCYANVDMVNASAVNTTMAMVSTNEYQRAYFANLNADNLTVVDGSVSVKTANIANTLTVGEGRNLTVEPEGSLTVKNVVIVGGEEDAPATISLERMVGLAEGDDPTAEEPSFTDANELASLGTLKITGNVTLADSNRPILILKNNAWEWTEEGEPRRESRSTEFDGGETVATVTNTNIPASNFAIEGENATVERSGANLIAAKAAVKVVLYDDLWNPIKEATYTSFEKGVSQLAKDFGSEEGHYDFILLEDTKLNANVTIPAFVKEMNLCSECVNSDETTSYYYERYLDLNGKTLTTSAKIGIYDGVRIMSGETKTTASGKIVSNYVGTQDDSCGLSIVEHDTLVSDNGTTFDYRACVLNNVIVTMKKADVCLEFVPDSIQNKNNDNFGLCASFDVKGFIVQNGSWTLEDILDKNKSYLKTGDLILEAGSYLEVASIAATNGNVVLNSAEVVTDGMTLTNVELYENAGRIQVNGNVTLSKTTLEVLGELYAKDIISSASRIHITKDEENGYYGNIYVDNLTINSAYTGDRMGDYTLDNQAGLLVKNNLTMKAGTLRNEDTVEAGTVNVKDMVNVGSFLCNNFTNTGKLTLEHDSILLINKNGIVNNVVLGYDEGQGNAALGRSTNGNINLKGTFTAPDEDTQLNAFVTDEYKDKIGNDEVKTDEGGNSWTEYPFDYIALWDDNNTPDDGSDDHDAYYIKVLAPNVTVFTTENKAFPVENIKVLPYQVPVGEEWKDNTNNCVRQSGKDLVVTGNYIHVDVEHAGNQTGTGLKSFSTWKDAVNYINSLNNTSARYGITIDNDCDIEGKLELPTKAAHLVIRSGKGYESKTETDNEGNPIWVAEPIALKYQGDIALNMDTTFENIYFAPYAVKNNVKSAAYGSMDTKGKQLELVSCVVVKYSEGLTGSTVNLTNDIYAFNNLKGTKTTKVILVYGADLRVNNNITNIGEIILNNESSLCANGGLSVDHIYSENWDKNCYDPNAIEVADSKAVLEVKDTLDMVTPTYVYSEGTMKLNNICSNCEGNTLWTRVQNSITITGDVYSWDPDAIFDTEPWVAVYDVGDDSKIVGYRKPVEDDYSDYDNKEFRDNISHVEVMKNAINVYNLAYGDSLANAPKVSSNWFITNPEKPGEVIMVDLTHKEGDLIKRGAVEQGNVSLSRIVGLNDEGGRITTPVNDFDTLQEAFTAIDKIGDKEAEYLVTINKAGEQVYIGSQPYGKAHTSLDKKGNLNDFTFPSKAAEVTINSESETKNIIYKKNITLKCNVIFEGVEPIPMNGDKANNINIGGYKLTMSGISLSNWGHNIVGNGVNKGSQLVVENSDLWVNKISQVDTVCLICEETEEIGTILASVEDIQIGNLISQGEGHGTLLGEKKINIENVDVSVADTAITTYPIFNTDKSSGKVTKAEPTLTISGEVIGELYVVISKNKEGAIGFSIDPNEYKELIGGKDGLAFAKAPKAITDNINLMGDGFDVGYITKKSGNLVYKTTAPQVELSYEIGYDEEKDEPIIATEKYETYADAIAQINALQTKQDYAIRFLKNIEADAENNIVARPATETSVDSPVTLTMPKDKCVNTLTLTSIDPDLEKLENESINPYADVYFKGDITFASNVILEDISFKQVITYKGTNYSVEGYQDKTETYANPIKLKVSGAYTLEAIGLVTFDNAMFMEGNGKATLVADNRGAFVALTSTLMNQFTSTGTGVGICIEGNIKNFTSVEVDYSSLDVLPYKIGTIDNPIDKSAELLVTNFNANYANVIIGDFLSYLSKQEVKSQGTFTVKNELSIIESEVRVIGDANLKNLLLDEKCMVYVTGTTFKIAGTVTSNTQDATFITGLNTKNQSALNISGDVVLTDPANKIGVNVTMPTDTDNGENNLYLGGTYKNTAGKEIKISNNLLTAKKADASAFKAHGDCLKSGNNHEYTGADAGYMLLKSGSDIKVYYADELEASVYKGEDVDGNLYGAYTSFNDAVAAIDALKDTDAEYTIRILRDIGTADKPQSIKLPSKAAKVTITSGEDDNGYQGYGIHYNKDLTLGCNTTFYKVVLSPAGKRGSEKCINVKGYKLTLNEITTNKIGGINGNGKDTVEINNDLIISGNVKNLGTLYLKNYPVEITGTCTVDTLKKNGVYLFKTDKKTVINNYIEEVVNSRSMWKYSDLTINGEIQVEDEVKTPEFIQLNQKKEAGIVGSKVTLTNDNKLLTVKKADISKIQFNKNDAGKFDNALWCKGAVYAVTPDAAANAVDVRMFTDTDPDAVSLAKCLDMTQASAYVDARADKDAHYWFTLSKDITDTDLTNDSGISKLNLPASGKMSVLDVAPSNIAGVGEGTVITAPNITFKGDIKVNGSVKFTKINFNSETDFSINCEKDTNEVSHLELVFVTVKGKQLKDIKGKKNITEVFVSSSTIDMTGGVTNVDYLEVNSFEGETAKLTTREKSEVSDLCVLDGEWCAFDKTTIGTVSVYEGTSGTLGTTLVNNVPQMTITGEVDNGVIVKLYEYDSKTKLGKEWTECVSAKDYNYNNKPLVIAKTAPADRFMAFGCLNTEKTGLPEGIKAYKDSKNYVYNGDISKMEAMITDGNDNVTYAPTYADAINIINTIGDSDGEYTITLRNTTDNKENDGKTVIKTAVAKDGSAAYGIFVLPAAGKAKSLTIVSEGEFEGHAPATPVTIKYTKTLKPNGNLELKLDNVILTEGTNKNGVFTETKSITLELGTANIILGDGVSTPDAATMAGSIIGNNTLIYGGSDSYKVVVSKITTKSGTLTLGERQSVLVNGDASVTTFVGAKGASLASNGKLAIGDVQTGDEHGINDEAIRIMSKNAITLGDISGSTELYIKTAYTAKEWKKANTQLTINGEVSMDAQLIVSPCYYNTKTYENFGHDMMADIMWDGNSKPAAYQKVIQAPKMELESLNLLGIGEESYKGSDNKFAKYDGGVYLLDDSVSPSIQVEGITYDEIIHDTITHYTGTFCTWDQAVKEIDKLNHKDWEYSIILLDDLGTDGTLKNLTMPSKANSVMIYSGGGEDDVYGIMMTGTNITLKTPLWIGVPIVAVKKSGKAYYSNAYTINIGKYGLLIDNMVDHDFGNAGFYSPQIILTGTAAGGADIYGDGYTNAITKINNIGTVTLGEYNESFFAISEGITGVGTLTIDPGVTVESKDKDVSVKNLVIGDGASVSEGKYEEPSDGEYASLLAKNITVSNTATLASSYMRAGTRTVGDGKVTLNNVIVKDNFNTIEAKQDKNGKSQVQIKGTVSLEDPTFCPDWSYITVGLYYNNSISRYAQLSEDMVLLTAPKAASTLFWPSPDMGQIPTVDVVEYDENGPVIAKDAEGNPIEAKDADGNYIQPEEDDHYILAKDDAGQPIQAKDGHDNLLTDENGQPIYIYYKAKLVPRETYGLYKSGNVIVYGKLCEVNDETGELVENIEARVWFGGDPGTVPAQSFTTFEAAVKAIDTMALQNVGENGKKTYKSYTIELVKDVEIGNEKGNNKYNTLTLPSKASEVKILGNDHSITFSGNLTLKCNTAFESIEFLPVKTVKNEAVSAKINLAVGNYKASFKWATFAPIDGAEGFTLGNITGSAKGEVIFEDGFYLEADNVTGINALTFRGTQEQYNHNHGVGAPAGNEEYKLDPWDGVLRIKNNLTVKDLRFEDLAQTKLYVGNTLTTNTVYLADKCDAYILHYENKPIKVNGATITENGVKCYTKVVTGVANKI